MTQQTRAQQAANKAATRIVKTLTGLGHQNAHRVAHERRVDLVPGGDRPATDVVPADPLIAGLTWADAVYGSADDERDLNLAAHVYPVQMLLHLEHGYEVTSDNVVASQFCTPDGITGRISAHNWSTLTIDGPIAQRAETGLDVDCPSATRVAAAIVATIDRIREAGDPAETIDANTVWNLLYDAGHDAFTEGGVIIVTAGNGYVGTFDLNGYGRVYENAHESEPMEKFQLDPAASTNAAYAAAIARWADANPDVSDATIEQGDTIWIAEVDRAHGTDQWAAPTEARAWQHIANYVRGKWEAERAKLSDPDRMPETPPADDREAVVAYFEAIDWEGGEVRQATFG